jgi:hypothetical protein
MTVGRSETGVGSVFYAGSLQQLVPPFQPIRLSRDGSAAHLRRMLNDLNQSPKEWNTPRLKSVIEALTGDASKTIFKRISGASRSYQEHLRAHVDLWIDTGKNKQGEELPSSRRPTTQIHEIVQRVCDTHSAIPIPVKDGYTVSPLPHPSLTFTGDRGLDAAELMFADMLISDWRLKIAKCVKCGRYFALKHWDRTYNDGAVCTRCVPRRKADRSAKHKKDKRSVAEQELYRLAARHFSAKISRDPEWQANAELKAEITDYLNLKIEQNPDLSKTYPKGITIKWLGWDRNRKGIAENLRKAA